MATKRQKKTVITGVTREAAEEAFGTYAKADAQIEKINAEIDLQCAKIREKHQQKLGELLCEREDAYDILQSYASEKKAELFSKKKSLEMSHGVIGFRTGTPKLKTLKGFTWASALNLMRTYLPGYIRQTEEIAKDRLLADRGEDFTDVAQSRTVPMLERMAACGIGVVQDETFFVELKKEDSGGAV